MNWYKMYKAKDASHAELVPYDSKQTHLTERFFGRHSSPCPIFFLFSNPITYYHPCSTISPRENNLRIANSTPNTPTQQTFFGTWNFEVQNLHVFKCHELKLFENIRLTHPSSSFAPAWPACWNSTQRRLPAHSTSVALGDFCPTETHGVKRQKGETKVRTCCGIAGCGWCCCSRPTCQVSRTSRNIWTE